MRILSVTFAFIAAILISAPAIQAPAAAKNVEQGLNEIKGRVAVPTNDIRTSVQDSVNFVVGFVSLAAVVAIIASGLVFLLGAGGDNSVQRAKKIIIYTLVGLLVIYFAKVIVGFAVRVVPGTPTA